MKYFSPNRLSKEEYNITKSMFAIVTLKAYIDYPIHWHEFYEFEYILSGKGTMVLNGIMYTLGKGDMYLLSPSDFHSVIFDREDPYTVINLKFSEELLRDELWRYFTFSNSDLLISDEGAVQSVIKNQLLVLLDEYQFPGSSSELILDSAVTQILIFYFLKLEALNWNVSKDASLTSVAMLQKSILYMQHHFREPLSLVEIATNVYLSPQYFSKLFHQNVGMTFKRFLQTLRLEHAKTLLLVSNLSVTEICQQSGFSSIAHFNRIFKQEHNVTPTAYRALNRQ